MIGGGVTKPQVKAGRAKKMSPSIGKLAGKLNLNAAMMNPGMGGGGGRSKSDSTALNAGSPSDLEPAIHPSSNADEAQGSVPLKTPSSSRAKQAKRTPTRRRPGSRKALFATSTGSSQTTKPSVDGQADKETAAAAVAQEDDSTDDHHGANSLLSVDIQPCERSPGERGAAFLGAAGLPMPSPTKYRAREQQRQANADQEEANSTGDSEQEPARRQSVSQLRQGGLGEVLAKAHADASEPEPELEPVYLGPSLERDRIAGQKYSPGDGKGGFNE